jgi:hypothetical protein
MKISCFERTFPDFHYKDIFFPEEIRGNQSELINTNMSMGKGCDGGWGGTNY